MFVKIPSFAALVVVCCCFVGAFFFLLLQLVLFLLFLSLLLLHSVCCFEGSSVFAGVFCFSNCLVAFLLCLLRHLPSIYSRVPYTVGNLISGSVFVWLSRLVVRAGRGSFFS